MLSGFDLEEHEEQMAMLKFKGSEGSEESEFAGRTLGTLRARTMLLLLWWISQMPLASAKNLSDIGFFPLGKIHRLLQETVDYGCIGRLDLGVGRRKTSRYFLHRKGIGCLNQGLPLIFRYAWQVTEPALERFICRLRMKEAIYDVATRILQSNAVRTPAFFDATPDGAESRPMFNAGMRLVRFTWLRSGPVHAIAEYRDRDGETCNLPFIWYGLHHGPDPLPAAISELFAGLKTAPEALWYGVPASPGGLVIVAIDRLAAFRARTQLAPHLPTAIVDASGNLIETLTPMRPYGALIETTVLPGPLGVPENLGQVVQNDATLAAVCGVPKNAAFEWVENWPGSRTTEVAEGIGQPRSAVKKIVEELIAAGLVRCYQNAFYPDQAGLNAAARRDRVSYMTVNRRLRGYLKDARCSHMKHHDLAVARLALQFRKEKMFVAPGWRHVINLPDKTQVAPDLWLLLPIGDGRGIWTCVEYERSAKADFKIDGKIGPYRSLLLEGQAVPMLMVTEEREPAVIFARRGDDIPMLVATHDDVISGPWYGPESVWRYRGATVDIDHLKTVVERPDLVERIDAQVTCDPVD